jgi:hypothetical protein
MSYAQRGFTGARRSIFSFAALALCLFTIASPALGDGSATPEPSMTIKLGPLSQEAAVTESQNATVKFSGSVKFENVDFSDRALAFLNSSVDTGWPSMISPSTLVVLPVEESFEVTVVVPAGSWHNITGTLVVKGHRHSGNQTITGEANATITPKAYYGVHLETDVSHYEITEGDSICVSFRVQNTGNAVDTFECEIVNFRKLIDDDHMTFTFSSPPPPLPPGESSIIKFPVASPNDEYFKGDHSIAIVFKVYSVTARDNGEDVNQTLRFTIHVKASWVLTISPYLVILGLAVAAAYLFWKPEGKPRGKPR